MYEKKNMITGDIDYNGYRGRYYYDLAFSPSGQTNPVILFLGGAFQSRNSWLGLKNRFSDRASALIIDLPGAVDEQVLPSHYSFEWIAAFVIEVLDRLNIDRVHIVASSYGTGLGYCLASCYTTRVDRLVLGGAVRELDPNTLFVLQRTIALVKQGDVEEAARYGCFLALHNMDPNLSIVRQDTVTKIVFRSLSRLSDLESKRYIANTDRIINIKEVVDRLPVPTCPVLGFTGEYDTLTTPRACRSLLKTLPQAIFTLIKNADHLTILEDPKTVGDLIELHLFGNLNKQTQLSTCTEFEDVGYLHSPRPRAQLQPLEAGTDLFQPSKLFNNIT